MFRSYRRPPRLDLPFTSSSVPRSPELCGLSVSAFNNFPGFALFTLMQKGEKLSSSFSYPCALFKRGCFDNSFLINRIRTLLQNTGGGVSHAAVALEQFLLYPQRVNIQHTSTPVTPVPSCACFTVPITPGVGCLRSPTTPSDPSQLSLFATHHLSTISAAPIRL